MKLEGEEIQVIKHKERLKKSIGSINKTTKSWKENDPKKLVMVMLFFLLIMGFIISAIILRNNSVICSDYVSLEYFGANGYASCKCTVDNESIYEKLTKKERDLNKLTMYKEFVDSVTAFSDSNNIKNGSKVHIKVEYDKNLAKKLGIRIQSSDYEVRARGIGKGTEIDLFENVSVAFAGVSPQAYVVITNNWEDDYLSKLEFTCESYSNIKKGDTINVTCSESIEQIAANGYLVKNNSAVYTADKLSVYADNKEQIDLNVINNLKIQAVKTIISETESRNFRMLYKATKNTDYLLMSNNESADDFSFDGAYFLTKKSNIDNGEQNFIDIFYHADIANGDITETVYFCFQYEQVFIDINGKFDVVSDSPEKRYKCSVSFDELEKEYIYDRQDTYNICDIFN